MTSVESGIELLLVGDEESFCHTTKRDLERSGFLVTDATSSQDAIVAVRSERPSIIVLDLMMSGLSGIETLKKVQKIEESIPVILLTGPGDFQVSLAGIRLDFVDFLQKPVNIGLLGDRIQILLKKKNEKPLREQSICELMTQPAAYTKLYVNDPVIEIFKLFRKTYSQHEESMSLLRPSVRSVLMYDLSEKFLCIIRFHDLLKLVTAPILGDPPYTSYFTGMFLTQCRVIGKRYLWELMADKAICVEHDAPLSKAVYLMAQNHLVNLPVMNKGELVGILREKDIIKEIADNIGKAI